MTPMRNTENPTFLLARAAASRANTAASDAIESAEDARFMDALRDLNDAVRHLRSIEAMIREVMPAESAQ